MEAYLVGAVRTPVGRRNGMHAATHPADLAAGIIKSLINGVRVDPAAVDDVILGCVDTVGPQSGDIARTAWLAAGLPEHVPGVTVDRQCGSSQQAVHFAAQAVMSGTADLIVAGGVQNMTQVPISSAMAPQGPYQGSRGWAKRYGSDLVDQFHSADAIAAQWSITPEEMRRFALESHHKAIAAIDSNRFKTEIQGAEDDECPRRDTTIERMMALRPLRDGGTTTAAMSSQTADGAAALLIANGKALRTHDLTPRARIRHLSARGDDPILMLTAPIPATAHALRRTGLSIGDIDRFEVNEAFASVVLAWLRETGADPARVNVNGGAIALGHPLGATGARLMVTMLHELERCGGRYGLQTMCEGGGQANVTVIERL
ncbi:acetyl-CoA C-acetyltransferase [Actinoplanes derwentensis]|uniref:Acetyl-CoA C-acetyltransferase n=1 Tax=Actinoplanes derwentensis TaxID=113562 RepID=A0A1H2AZS1_9ACTN|nr:acetyl-CoA C-acetyltransferase [Actinoplanes derwentensis]GID87210.1 acetyl-CoA acetyltransferase [Actinoplanes derwentensis]SDT51423.1 acetyl-CoA C-acetyltransferase [Actinoplanes derwentensis]